MKSLAYAQGSNHARTKLGLFDLNLTAKNSNLTGRLMHRAGTGAAVGSLAAGMTNNSMLSGAAYGAGGGLLLGALPSRGSRPTTPARANAAPERLERFHQYLATNPHTPLAKNLQEQAFNRDITLGAIGGGTASLIGSSVAGSHNS